MAVPDLHRAEQAACELLLSSSADSLPVNPLMLLSGMARIYTYEEMAQILHLSLEQVEASCGGADAFTVRKGGQTVVAYRADGNPARRNFTIAHEIGHIVLEHPGICDAFEQEADHFASCLLVPLPVLEMMQEFLGADCTDALPRLLYVSPACARQARKRKNFMGKSENFYRLEEKFRPACEEFCRFWLKKAGKFQ